MRRDVRAGLTALAARRVHLRWSNLFGVAAFACLLVLGVTGALLAVWYTPSNDLVTYDGPYGPLRGATVTEAFASTMLISFEVTGGLLLRQTHHWAALVMPAAMVVQLLVTFFTGAFRAPRRAAWVLLVAAFLLVLLAGWSGYALPDDMLSGTGLRIVEGVVLGIPVVGTWLAGLLFGGPFPGRIIENLYPVHVVVAPALLLVVLALRAALAVRHGQPRHPPTLRPGLGLRLWPDAALRAAGMTGLTTAVLLLLGATSTISPVWSYGPASGGEVGAGSQPDWYTGFLDGALRLVPAGWETVWGGYTITFAVLAPLAVVGGYFLLLVVYPYLEAWVEQDRAVHDQLDRPRNVPTRTGVGVAGMLFYGILWGAASADLVATAFSVSFESVITTLQVALVVGPPLAFEVTRRVSLGLQRKDRELLAHGHETGRVVRMPDGGYVEVHRPLTAAERERLGVVRAGTVGGGTVGGGTVGEGAVGGGARRPRGARRGRTLRNTLARVFEDGHVVPAPSPARTGALERARREPGLERGGVRSGRTAHRT